MLQLPLYFKGHSALKASLAMAFFVEEWKHVQPGISLDSPPHNWLSPKP